MLKEILYNDIFGIIICLLSFVGMLLFSIIEMKNEKMTNEKINKKSNCIETTQNIIISAETLILFLICICFCAKNSGTIMTILYIFATLYTLHKSFTKITFDKKDNYLYLCASYFYYLFFKKSTIKITYSYIHMLPSEWQEPLTLLLLFLKISLFIFFLLINFRIILSYLYTVMPKDKIKKLLKKKDYIIKAQKYNYYLFNKKQNTVNLIIDCIIFAITLPFFIFFFLSKVLLAYVAKAIKAFIKKMISLILSIYQESDIIIKKISKISMVLTMVFIYVLVIYDSFTPETKELYNIVAITIICPIIIDSINTKTRVR